MKIFYSWQSWTPSEYNRNIIENALKEAAKRISKDETLKVEVAIDRDTKGEAGSVRIDETIFRKIDECEIFLCDATIVTPRKARKASPNPNVMLELGYAAKSKDWENIICVVNEYYGAVEKLPFDLRPRRLLFYRLPDDTDISIVNKMLVSDIEKAIRSVLAKQKPTKPLRTKQDQLDELLQSNSRHIELEKFIQNEVNEVDQKIRSTGFIGKREATIRQHVNDKKALWLTGYSFYVNELKDFLLLIVRLAQHGKAIDKRLISRMLKQLSAPNTIETSPYLAWPYVPSLLLIYTIGITAIISDNWSFVSAILDENLVEAPSVSPRKTKVKVLDAIIEYAIVPYENDAMQFREPYSLGKQIVTLLAPLFEAWSLDEDECSEALNKFEFLFALISFELPPRRSSSYVLAPQCFRILFNPQARNQIYEFLHFAGSQGNEWGPLKGGLFRLSQEEFISALEKFQAWIDAKLRERIDSSGEVGDFVNAYNR